MTAIIKKISIVFLLAGIIASQYAYDENRVKNPPVPVPPLSAGFIKAFDLGLHAATADFYWINNVITELPFLRNGFDAYQKDLELVNQLDPRFSFPYYWTVLVLPNTRYPDAINAAIAIGDRGVREADEDWRVSFFLATLYHLYKNDRTDAAKYFDLAARDPKAPFYIKRFSENYGIAPNARAQTEQVWEAIYQSSGDPVTKERAKNYIIRLKIFDFLEQEVEIYKQKYGKLPATVDDLVTGGILKGIPPDPYGFQFKLYGETVGIVKD